MKLRKAIDQFPDAIGDNEEWLKDIGQRILDSVDPEKKAEHDLDCTREEPCVYCDLQKVLKK